MPKHKCIFCTKHKKKELYRCEITGQSFKNRCFGYTPTELKYAVNCRNKCPYFTASIFDRIGVWIDLH